MLSRLQNATPGVVTVFCALAALIGCGRSAAPAGEQRVLDERIQLTRTAGADTAKREWNARADSTCVAIVEEDDSDVTLTLSAKTGAAAVKSVVVESLMNGEGIELATLHVPRASQVVLAMKAPPVGKAAGLVPTRISCHADAAEHEARLAEKLEAYRAWTQATLSGSLDPGNTKDRIANIDAAIATLDSPAGDARMAAWARLVRAAVFYRVVAAWGDAYHASLEAERAFSRLDKPELRNVSRARFLAAMSLVEIVNDGGAKNPTSAEATAGAPAILKDLDRDDRMLSAIERQRAENLLGVFCYEIDDYPCAEQHMKSALARARANHDGADVLKFLSNLGTLSMERGEYRASSEYFAQVFERMDEIVEPSAKVIPLVNASFVDAAIGNTDRAIELLVQGARITAESGSLLDQGRVAQGFGQAYWRRGDLVQAEAFFDEALRVRRLATDANGMNTSLRVSGMLARENGHLDRAIELHREAVARAAHPSTIMRAKMQLGRDYAVAKDFARAIAITREALTVHREAAPISYATGQLAVVEYQLARGITPAEVAAARAPVRDAFDLASRSSDPLLEVFARRIQAALLAASGDLSDARREYERAIALIFDFRGLSSSPELQASSVAHEQDTFREYVDLLMRETVKRGAGKFANASASEENALRVLELARALNFDPVRDTQLDSAQQTRLDQLLQQMASKRVRLAVLRERSVPSGGDVDQLQFDMAQLRREVDQLRGPATKVPSSELPSLVARPLSALAPGVVQLSYALGTDRAYLWVRDEEGLRVAMLSESPAQIERKLDLLSNLNHVREGEKVQSALIALSGTLLPPRSLSTGSSSIDVVVEGKMANVPFAALRSPLDRTRRLIETHNVRMITSMFETRTGAGAPRRAMAFVGISTGAGKMRDAARVFPALGTTHLESQTLARLFEARGDGSRVKLLTGADGNVDSIKTMWQGGADVVHFATHGLANVAQPIASLLLLPAKSEKGEPTYLTAGQVREWQGDAGLVFLGACETAAGPARFADGIPGLPRAFLHAGARGVVATLWPVEDVPESQFSLDFYRRFAATGDAARALAETQRAWLTPVRGDNAADQARRLMTAWAHVFYVRSSG